MSTNQPNIILINCDDLGYGDLGCYGSQVHHTPVLDQMALEGMKFTSFYMASSVCSPSRGAMMTGCYPPRIGFGFFENRWVLLPGHALGLNPEEETIAKSLNHNGYATMLIGKWHCGDQPEFLPTRHGFDHYYGLPYSNDMGRQVGKEHYPPLPLMIDEAVIQEQPDQTSLTERYAEQAVRFMRTNKDQPFFLYLAHMYVHLPLYVPSRFEQQSKNGKYGAAVSCIDWVTGVILDELKRLDLDQRTLVIFTSDNGSKGIDGSNAPLRGGKGTTWEGGMRVPCIMRWPGTIPPASVCDELVTGMDLYPTLVRLSGGEVPDTPKIDGKDIQSLLFQEPDRHSPYDAFFYYLRNELQAVRVKQWKLHVWRNDEPVKELYNLEDDVSESRNVYESYPHIVQQLEQRLADCRLDLGDSASGIEGQNCRPAGRAANPMPLTQFQENHPYFTAMYDLKEFG